MKKLYKAALTLALVCPLASHAGEAEDQLIKKVVQAHGGQALLDMRNYRIQEQYLSPTIGQSNSASLTEVAKSRQVLLVDIENNSASFDNWFDGRGGGFQGSTITDGENGQSINYQSKTYGATGSADVYVLAGGMMRTSPAILAYELDKARDKAVLGDDEKVMSRLHHTISIPFPSSPDLKLYVDAQTHLITRMRRINAQLGNLDYVFSNFKSSDGIRYAGSTIFSIAGSPNLISTKRELSFNNDIADDAFAIPEGFSPEGERMDTSEMLVNKVSDRAYHVGQGNGYSLFVNTSMGTVGVGGYPALPARFDRYKQASENFKPLTYQVVTHHHSDHLGAIPEAVSLGARIVTVDENVDEIKANTNPAPSDDDFLLVGNRTTLGEGRNRVEIYEVSTIHANSFLLTYVPADKIIFIADHMGSPYATGTPVAGNGTVDMLSAIDALKLDVKKIATAHSARIFTIKDMRDSVAAYAPNSCLGNRPACP